MRNALQAAAGTVRKLTDLLGRLMAGDVAEQRDGGDPPNAAK